MWSPRSPQRYSYVAWQLEGSGEDDEASRARMVQRFLRWTVGATLGQIRWFAAFTVAQPKKALAGPGAVEVPAVSGEVLWILPGDLKELAGFQAPEREDIQLLSGSDSLMLLRRNAADLFDDAGVEAGRGMNESALAADLSDHPIVGRGRIIGSWQHDPGNARNAWWTVKPMKDGVLTRISPVEEWITEDLGDSRSFSLDSLKSRAKNIAKLDALRSR